MTRWAKLFGTPVAAAETILGKGLLYDLLNQCDECPKYTGECLEPRGTCSMETPEAVLEWLEGDDG